MGGDEVAHQLLRIATLADAAQVRSQPSTLAANHVTTVAIAAAGEHHGAGRCRAAQINIGWIDAESIHISDQLPHLRVGQIGRHGQHGRAGNAFPKDIEDAHISAGAG